MPDEFGIDFKLIETLRPFFQFLYHVYFRVDSEGAANIPKKGPVIIVANHSGALPYDGAMIHMAVFNEHPSSRTVRFLVENFVFDMPLLGRTIERLGGVRANFKNAITLLQKRWPIVIFPEGVDGISKPYEERYQLRRFGRGGFVRLAIRTASPVIPAAVIGAEEIHPVIWKSSLLAKPLGVPFIPFTPTFPWLGPMGLVPLPTKWKIVFGKPIFFNEYNSADAANDKLVKRLALKIKNIVQSMVNLELAKRKSIWR